MNLILLLKSELLHGDTTSITDEEQRVVDDHLLQQGVPLHSASGLCPTVILKPSDPRFVHIVEVLGISANGGPQTVQVGVEDGPKGTATLILKGGLIDSSHLSRGGTAPGAQSLSPLGQSHFTPSGHSHSLLEEGAAQKEDLTAFSTAESEVADKSPPPPEVGGERNSTPISEHLLRSLYADAKTKNTSLYLLVRDGSCPRARPSPGFLTNGNAGEDTASDHHAVWTPYWFLPGTTGPDFLVNRRVGSGKHGRQEARRKLSAVLAGADAATEFVLTELELRLNFPVLPGPPLNPLLSQPKTNRTVQIDLFLAVPRPKVLDRLLATLATFGVRSIFLTPAAKVELSYFDGKRLSNENIQKHLIEGIEQACWKTNLPKVRVCPPKMRASDVLQKIVLSKENYDVKVVAHPASSARKMGEILEEATLMATSKEEGGMKMLLAIGPEGGWSAEEMTECFGAGETTSSCTGDWEHAKLGPRILKTHDAAVALLSLIYDYFE